MTLFKIRWIYCFLILCLVVHSLSLFAQESGTDEVISSGTEDIVIKFDKDYLKSYYSDTKSILSSPKRWGKEEWITFSAVAGITATLLVFDKRIQKWTQKNRLDYHYDTYNDNVLDEVTQAFEFMDSSVKGLVPLASLHLIGYGFKNERMKRVALLTTESVAISGLFTLVLKNAINRERPSGLGVYHDWGPRRYSNPGESMPSGHAVMAFAYATVFAEEFRDIKAVPVISYSLATLIAASRVHDNRHWASDAFIGACIGYFTSKAIIKLKKNRRVKFVTNLTPGNGYVGISYKF